MREGSSQHRSTSININDLEFANGGHEGCHGIRTDFLAVLVARLCAMSARSMCSALPMMTLILPICSRAPADFSRCRRGPPTTPSTPNPHHQQSALPTLSPGAYATIGARRRRRSSAAPPFGNCANTCRLLSFGAPMMMMVSCARLSARMPGSLADLAPLRGGGVARLRLRRRCPLTRRSGRQTILQLVSGGLPPTFLFSARSTHFP